MIVYSESSRFRHEFWRVLQLCHHCISNNQILVDSIKKASKISKYIGINRVECEGRKAKEMQKICFLFYWNYFCSITTIFQLHWFTPFKAAILLEFEIGNKRILEAHVVRFIRRFDFPVFYELREALIVFWLNTFLKRLSN